MILRFKSLYGLTTGKNLKPKMFDLSKYLWLGNDTIFVLLCCFCLILTVTWFVTSVSRINKEMNESLINSGKGDKQAIPGPQPTDKDLGNLGDVAKAGGIHLYLKELHEKHGAVVAFWWGEQQVISVASPDLWKDIQGLFDRPPLLFKLFEPLLGKSSIQYSNGPTGRKKRQLYDRSFSHEAVKEYYDKFVHAVEVLAEKWESTPKEEHIPLCESMMALAIHSIAVSGMGKLFKNQEDVLNFAHVYNTCWDEMEQRLGGTFPEPGSEREIKFEEAKEHMVSVVSDIVKQRKNDPDKEEHLFIDSVIDADFISEQEVLNDIITFMVGGFHTTGNMMVWCIYYLALHPDIQERVYNEMIDVLGNETINGNVSAELQYTRQVLDETLRAAVLAPYAARFYEFDLQVGEHKIPAETPIITAFGVVLQDPKLYPEPQRFDPDRFSPEETKKRPSLAYQPFGFAGKRKCPGWRFSLAEGLVFLSVLCRKFKFHLVEGQNVEPVFRLVSSPKEEVWITVTKRVES